MDSNVQKTWATLLKVARDFELQMEEAMARQRHLKAVLGDIAGAYQDGEIDTLERVAWELRFKAEEMRSGH
jgi:hypothetical protein